MQCVQSTCLGQGTPECLQGCSDQGTPAAQQKFSALALCLFQSCPTWELVCVLTATSGACQAQTAACQADGA